MDDQREGNDIDKLYPQRSPMRLKDYDYSTPGYYAVTLCIEDRRMWWGQIHDETMQLNRLGRIVEKMWKTLPRRYIGLEVDQHMMMPNHFHGIIVLTEESRRHLYVRGKHKRPPTLGDVVGTFKGAVTYYMHKAGASDFAWQAGFFDVIIRCSAHLDYERQYILNNPVRWAEKQLERQGKIAREGADTR